MYPAEIDRWLAMIGDILGAEDYPAEDRLRWARLAIETLRRKVSPKHPRDPLAAGLARVERYVRKLGRRLSAP